MPFARIDVKDKNQLEELLIQEVPEVEEGLTFINRILTDMGNIILCHDANGRIVIIEPCIVPDEKALFDGLRYLDHYESVMAALRTDNEDTSKLKYDAKPRLILVAPSFSDDLQRIVSHLDIHIDLYEWEYLKLGDQCGLYLKPTSSQISEEQRLWTRLKTRLLEYSRKPSAEVRSKTASSPDEEAMEAQSKSRIRMLKRPSRLFGKIRGLRRDTDRETPQQLEPTEELSS